MAKKRVVLPALFSPSMKHTPGPKVKRSST
jgi:hypothetical protein